MVGEVGFHQPPRAISITLHSITHLEDMVLAKNHPEKVEVRIYLVKVVEDPLESGPELVLQGMLDLDLHLWNHFTDISSIRL